MDNRKLRDRGRHKNLIALKSKGESRNHLAIVFLFLFRDNVA